MATGRDNEYVQCAGKGVIGLLFIEPQSPASHTPVIDEATRKMTTALRSAERGLGWMGTHSCVCGAESGSRDLYIGRFVTNSLAVHYLAHHREEVPADELADALAMLLPETEPTAEELTGR